MASYRSGICVDIIYQGARCFRANGAIFRHTSLRPVGLCPKSRFCDRFIVGLMLFPNSTNLNLTFEAKPASRVANPLICRPGSRVAAKMGNDRAVTDAHRADGPRLYYVACTFPEYGYTRPLKHCQR